MSRYDISIYAEYKVFPAHDYVLPVYHKGKRVLVLGLGPVPIRIGAALLERTGTEMYFSEILTFLKSKTLIRG